MDKLKLLIIKAVLFFQKNYTGYYLLVDCIYKIGRYKFNHRDIKRIYAVLVKMFKELLSIQVDCR